MSPVWLGPGGNPHPRMNNPMHGPPPPGRFHGPGGHGPRMPPPPHPPRYQRGPPRGPPPGHGPGAGAAGNGFPGRGPAPVPPPVGRGPPIPRRPPPGVGMQRGMHAPVPGRFAPPPMPTRPVRVPSSPPPYEHSPPSRPQPPPPMHGLPPVMRPVPSMRRVSLQPPPVPRPPPPPHPSQHPAPLKESRTLNVRPASPPPSNERIQKPSPEKKSPVKTPQHNADMQDAASILLGMRTTMSPPTTEESTKRDVMIVSSQSEDSSSVVSYPTRLALPEDDTKLNSMHCFLRSELLELFVLDRTRSPNKKVPKISTENKSPSPGDQIDDQTSVGSSQCERNPRTISCSERVGLRCVHCAQARKFASSDSEAPMAVFYPKSISELYRLVTSWQRVHLRKCRNLPPSVRERYVNIKETDKTRGKTQYWITSAKKLGLVDCTTKAGGIRFSSLAQLDNESVE